MRRCGVSAGNRALDLAQKAASTQGVTFDGLQAYEGHLVTTPDFNERRQKVEAAMQAVIETKAMIEKSGLKCGILSGGGTGTYEITGNIPGFSEIQAGSYALMDCSYKKVSPMFRNAMSVLATIVSSSAAHAVADVGLKGMGNEFGLPEIVDCPEARPRSIAEEHLVIDNLKAEPGDKVRIIPSHGCTTSNLHRRFWIVRSGMVEAMWPIEASGALE
jgi:D-serine deaminase-like pyridoxal phosphate-dependent protein